MTTSRREGPKLPDIHEQTIRFWWAPPDRLREDVTSNIPHQNRTVIWNDGSWWLQGEAFGAVSNEQLDEAERANHGAGGGEHFLPLLDPGWAIAALELGEIRPGDGVLHVDARFRDDPDDSLHLHRLPLTGGADRFALDVDAETGILRAVDAFLDGEELSALRLVELTLGEDIDEEHFARPHGVDFEPPGGDVRQLTLEEAAAQAPFTVFYVPQLPDGLWRLRVHRIRRPTFNLWLVHHRADGRESFSLGQSADEPPDAEDEHTLVFERDGTHLVLRSDSLDRARLRDLAAKLERFTPG